VRDEVDAHLLHAAGVRDFEGVNLLYQALVKASRQWPGSDEGQHLVAMLDALPESELARIVQLSAVDVLLDLDPPLETLLSHPEETLRTRQVTEALTTIRNVRRTNPRTAALHLAMVLKRVRDKRYHGFKSIHGNRDAEILGAARAVLEELARIARRLSSAEHVGLVGLHA
jgi:hypothetical protein